MDIGSVGQTTEYSLWDELEASAGALAGIDTQPSKNPAIVCGDMETYDFGRKFDVVVAGDVLEHVSNQGLFLDNVRRHLRDGGALVITTPNAKWWTAWLKPNPTHALWHDRYTLQRILEVHGFRIEKIIYYPGNKKFYPLLLRPLISRQALLVVCRPRAAS